MSNSENNDKNERKIKNDAKAVLSMVNADDPAVHGYCESVNERDFVGFPFWVYYDSESKKVLQAGACK